VRSLPPEARLREDAFRLAGLTRGDFAAGKRQAARFFFAHELPRVVPLLELLEARDRTVLDMHDDLF